MTFKVLTLTFTGLLGLATGASALQPGEEAPDWTLPDIKNPGQTIMLSELRGKPVLLDFWAVWCPPCRAAMQQELQPMHQEHGERDDWMLISVGTNWRGEGPDQQLQFANENNYGWTFVHDTDGSVTEQYGVEGIPTLVWIDSNGIVQSIGHGEVALEVRQQLGGGASSTHPQPASVEKSL